MKIQFINPDQLAQFAEITDRLGSEERFAKMVQGMWESGESRPEWCFIGHDDDNSSSRVGFFAVDGQPDVLAIMGWTLPWNEDYLPSGTKLFEGVLPQLRNNGVRLIQRELYSSYGTFKKQEDVLKASGFELLQTQVIYELSMENKSNRNTAKQLTFKSLSDLDKTSFNNVVEKVTADTKDRAIQKLVATDGLAKFVDDSFDMLKSEHDVDPSWWCLAYDPNGEVVGFIQPVKFPNSSEGNIAYMGIVPEQRGKGYSGELLHRATQVLVDAGIEFINGRTDSKNIPMQRAFEKLNYTQALQVSTYEIKLEIQTED